jgi:hypothetical protein
MPESQYKLHCIDSNGISSSRDKELNRELVDPSNPYRFGTYGCVKGTYANNRVYRCGGSLKPPALFVTSGGNGKLLTSYYDRYSTVMVLESSNFPHVPGRAG